MLVVEERSNLDIEFGNLRIHMDIQDAVGQLPPASPYSRLTGCRIDILTVESFSPACLR